MIGMKFTGCSLKKLCVLAGLFALNQAGALHGQTSETALDEWMRIDEGVFDYKVIKASRIDDIKHYQIFMISQRWLDPSLVDRVEWTHWVNVYIPDDLQDDTALLFIGGGSNRDFPPDRVNSTLVKHARDTKAVTLELGQVPNQPLVFEGKSGPLTEDGLIAYAWNKYLQTNDPTWLPRLPMTKSAVKAMDMVTSFVETESAGRNSIHNFIVAGGSKRGWTTWTTAVVDSRVIGIVPIVIDMLNLVPSFQHHWESYGFYAPAVGDYERSSIMQWRESKEFAGLLKIVEPYEYRDRLTLPKLLLNATGDQFFLSDSWKFYWNDLQGENHLRYVPNADHSLRDTDAPDSITSFFYCISNGIKLPEVDWNTTRNGQVRAKPSVSPSSVRLWSAHNPGARDFRVESLGKVWKSEDLTPNERGFYRSRIQSPKSGFTAFLIEFTFEIEGCPSPVILTTGTHILPDFLPFDFDTGEARPRPQ